MTDTMGDRIRKLRCANGWAQAVLANRVGLSVATIGKLERDRLDPRGQTVQTLASVFGCSVPYLLYGNTGWWARLLDKWPVLESVELPGVISEKVDVPQTAHDALEDAGYDDQRTKEAYRNSS